jgi:flagellar protein FlaG
MDVQPRTATAVIASSQSQREKPALPRVAVPAPEPAPAAKPAQEKVKEAVEEMQRNISSSSTDLQFSVDSATGRTIVSVVDAETKEIVRQIPTEEVMKLAHALDRMQGLLFKGKA